MIQRKYIYLFLCFISLLFSIQSSAQNVALYSSKQGLSNSCIRNIYEDSRHNIWITTQNGLNRFDGSKINVYRHEEDDPSSLLHNESTAVYEYDRNRAIIGTGSGLQAYNYATNKFEQIPILGNDSTTLVRRIVSIYGLDDKGKRRILVCYAGYGCGEVVENPDGSLCAKQTSEFNTTQEEVNPIFFLQDKDKNIWFINSRQNVYRRVGNKLKLYPELNHVVKMCMSSSNRLYAATSYDGIYVYDKKTDHFTPIASGAEVGGFVYGFNPWTLGRIFICTDGGGLRIYDEQTKTVTQSTIKFNDFNLATANVKDAIADSHGNVWVGIYYKGVMMKPVSQSSFEYIGSNSITKNSIGTSSVSAIERSTNGNLWVATDNDGLYLMSPDGFSSTHWNKANTPGMPSAFTSIAPLSNTENLLLGTFFDGLWQKNGNSFSSITRDINLIFSIKPADDGAFWIATMGQGFYYYNPTTHNYIEYSRGSKNGGADIIGNNYVYTLLQHGSKLYVGTADGLVICRTQPHGIIKEKSTKILGANAIRDLVMSPDGKFLWVATNNGLVRINIKTLEEKSFTKKDGLPINSVSSLSIKNGKLWMGTEYGLCCMDMAKETFNSFYLEDGIQDNEFSRGASVIQGDKLYFGGISGITYFDSKTIEKRQEEGHQLKLRFIDLLVEGNTVHKGDMSGRYSILDDVLDDCERINLGHDDNQFTLEMSVDGVTNQHTTYEYSINGDDWTTQGADNNRLVFNLKSGTYHIRVRALAFGAISEEREITVVIHPAWYASFVAKCIYFLLGLLLIWLAYEYAQRQMRERKLEMMHQQEREINEARIQFFMNISHEVRTPMTLILAPLERLISNDKDPERQRSYSLIKQNSNRILRLINQMMDVRKIEQGKFQLDYQQVELVSLLQNIFDVFTANAQNRKIKYEFLHDMPQLITFVDADNMDKIVMNLLSNAFKFTPDKGKITLSLSTPTEGKGDSFLLSVTDSGVGIPAEDKEKIFDRFYSGAHKNGYIGTGIGLNLTSMLVKLHNGDITVLDNPEGAGSQFLVNIPVGDKSLVTRIETPEPPVAEEEEATEPEKLAAAPLPDALLELDKPSDTHNKHIVLVEDDEAIRQYVHSELSSDFVITECTNGEEAWNYIITHPNKVNLIISDIMMPVMDGMTLCQKVKANFNTNHIPIILMTALGSDADRIAGITNGADGYISKPFNIDVLRSLAINLLKTRQLLRGKYNAAKKEEEHIDKIDIESPDEHLMRRVMKCINENIDNPELSVEMIADQVGISRVHFYRKMKDLTGQSPRDYLKYVRLKEAARLIKEKKNIDITGISIAVGFKSLSSFSTSFKALYGKTPSEWAKED